MIYPPRRFSANMSAAANSTEKSRLTNLGIEQGEQTHKGPFRRELEQHHACWPFSTLPASAIPPHAQFTSPTPRPRQAKTTRDPTTCFVSFAVVRLDDDLRVQPTPALAWTSPASYALCTQPSPEALHHQVDHAVFAWWAPCRPSAPRFCYSSKLFLCSPLSLVFSVCLVLQ
ncbi:hypothetical protein K402DRAFT_202524 [Aulographum hederae CBS 113979]|uniref:Uncharacterized protein n=1 Tax=Aulographum hederae CBS 113979 TaxID=1176131 RepID=A0A6G1HCE7_9PEZI|nr:hypothetical protein K402DRAFT_202524 [Aulographum hederae CBS 113979]